MNTRDSQVLHPYRLLSKTCFANGESLYASMTSSTYQTQSMNYAVFVSESPQARFHERNFASHVSKIGGNTMMPSSWSVDKTVHGLQQPNTLMMLHFATFETTRELVRRTCRKLVSLTQFSASVIVVVVRMLLVQVSLKKCTLHVSICEFENQVTQHVSGKSDEFDGMRLGKTLGSCRVFGPYNFALPTVLSMNHHVSMSQPSATVRFLEAMPLRLQIV